VYIFLSTCDSFAYERFSSCLKFLAYILYSGSILIGKGFLFDFFFAVLKFVRDEAA